MTAIFKTAVAGDAMSLPVHNLEDALPFYENIMGFRIVRRRRLSSIFAHTGFSPLSSAPSVIEAFAIPQTKGVFPSGSQYAFLELGLFHQRQREQGGRPEDLESAPYIRDPTRS